MDMVKYTSHLLQSRSNGVRNTAINGKVTNPFQYGRSEVLDSHDTLRAVININIVVIDPQEYFIKKLNYPR